MLPVSGAEQLKASDAIGERPMISQSGAYSRFVSPAPRPLSGRKRFQRPRSRAFAFSSSMRSEEHTSELQSLAYLVCRLLLEKKKKTNNATVTPIVDGG